MHKYKPDFALGFVALRNGDAGVVALYIMFLFILHWTEFSLLYEDAKNVPFVFLTTV